MKHQTQPRDVMDLYAEHLREWGQRFTVALEATGFDSLIIYAGEEQLVFRDDAAYPFAAEPYFKALVPLTRHPGCAIHFEPGKRPRLVYFQDAGFWHEPPAVPEGDWIAHFDLRCVGTHAERRAALPPLTGRIAAIGPAEAGWFDSAIANDPSLLAQLDYTRARKTAYEVACIEQANAVAAVGHRAAQLAYAENASEFTIDRAYCEATRQRSSDLPYPNIVALNEHAAVLHYQNLRHDAPGTPSSLLLDAGAGCNGYAADVTRTVAQGSKSMQALIAGVDTMQQTLCAKLRSGMDFVTLNAHAHELVAEVLHEHGMLRCAAAEALERGVTRTFLPHGLGHLLGLQVHDAGGRLASPDGARRDPPPEHPMLRLTRVLEPGFVVTIEPGIYFIPSLLDALRSGQESNAIDWAAVEALRPFGGVRIEDDVLVTPEGARNLSRPALEAAGAW
jgi:Xaa-Pro dipeptidase